MSKDTTFKLSESFLRNKSEEQKQHIEDSFVSARSFLKAFTERLEFKLSESIVSSENSLNYDKASWALEQADSIGYRRALRDILNLLIDNK